MIKIIWTAKDETELRLTQNGMKPAEAARLMDRTTIPDTGSNVGRMDLRSRSN